MYFQIRRFMCHHKRIDDPPIGVDEHEYAFRVRAGAVHENRAVRVSASAGATRTFT